MEFKVKDKSINITNEMIIKDIKRVFEQNEQHYLSMKDYDNNGCYTSSLAARRFGSWLTALKIAGIRMIRSKDELVRISNEAILQDINDVALSLGTETLTYSDYQKVGKVSTYTIHDRFGSWSNVLKLSGLKPTSHIYPIADKDLFYEIEKIWISIGRQPTTTDMKKGISKYSLDTFTRRFGGWPLALKNFVTYMNSNIESKSVMENEKPEQKIDSNDNEIISDTFYVTDKISRRKTPRNINYRLRYIVIKRDNFCCIFCGASPSKDPTVELHVDHIIPWSKGGETVIDNLQTLCSKCNYGKSDLD